MPDFCVAATTQLLRVTRQGIEWIQDAAALIDPLVKSKLLAHAGRADKRRR